MLTPTGSVFRGAADRGYVEPEPMVFARLAHLTDSTISGLDAFGMLSGGILHVGTGGANTIYVIVPVDGALRIAKGSVYNYYQFTDTKRLTDSEWQTLIGLNYMNYDDPSFKSVGPDDKPEWTLSYRMENE